MILSLNRQKALLLCSGVFLINHALGFIVPSPATLRPRTFLYSSQDDISPSDIEEEHELVASMMEEPSEPVKVVNGEETPIEIDTLLERTKLKNEFLTLIASTDRGQVASTYQKETASTIISELAALNPIEETTTSSFSRGTWELVYSDTQLFRSSPFFMAGRAVCQDGDEAERYDWFCDMHRAALAISIIGKVRQIVSSEKLVSEFEVKVGSIPFLNDFTPFAYSGGLPMTIEGAIVSSATIEESGMSQAYKLFMDTVQIKGSNIPLLRSILDSPNVKLQSRELGGFLEDTFPDQYTNPKPVFETIYLDEEGLRISRDQDGKLFAYTKVSDSEEETDYVDVMPDLGFSKLLEGFNDKILKFYI